MEVLDLPPELEEFVTEAIASGRFCSKAEVIRAALQTFRDAEAELAQFRTSLEEAVAEAERDGYVTVDQVYAEVLAEIEAVRDGKG